MLAMRQARAKRSATDDDGKVVALPADRKYLQVAEDNDLPVLEDKQHDFVANVLMGLTSEQAYRQAGYSTQGLSSFAVHGRAVRLRRQQTGQGESSQPKTADSQEIATSTATILCIEKRQHGLTSPCNIAANPQPSSYIKIG